ncbi:MFS general substrate transporter [Lindgomyces ingoldianus]|uniref:MFS general substrate transporter n=1 Tax=Lindgomyces ingoldianus TaxID=673940 RepID=A0ACB6RGI4_9PLEO|nr:MFS general substrate transporter [Lindgomyces ingoldianus]KAF2477576.1 MFS general substrate transporter [Lindgomyces ingoldianus]
MARENDRLDKTDVEEITEVTSHDSFSSETSDASRTLWQNIKKYRKVVGYTFALTSAILLYGYDNVVVGTVSGMPGFQKDFGRKLDDKWILPSSWLALWNVSSPIGAMCGSLAGGWLQDRIGRRLALASCSLLSAVSVAIMFVSYLPADIDGRRGCFFAGKLFQGFSIGAVMAATQTYMSEILPPVLRGSGMAFFPVFTLLGQLTGALVIFGSLNKGKGYTVAFGSQWPFSFVPIVVALFIPESPAYYVRKRQMDKALNSQARLDPLGVDTKANVEKIRRDIEHEEQLNKASFAECFHKRNLLRTFIVMWANSLTSIFGLPLLGKASYFLQIVGMGADSSVLFLILGIVLGLIANGVSVWAMSRVGRRPLINISLSVAAALWLSNGIANCFHSGAVVWWTAVSMMLVIIVCGVGVWPASFAVAAETSSLQLRAQTQGIGWFVSAFTSAVSGIVLPYVFNPDAGNLRGKVGFTYVGSCILGVVVSWFLIPEMKGRTIGEIDRMFELKIPARAFKSWRNDGDGESQVRTPPQPWV